MNLAPDTWILIPLFFHDTLLLFPHVITDFLLWLPIPFHRVLPVPLVFDANKGGVCERLAFLSLPRSSDPEQYFSIGHPLSHRKSERRCLLRIISAIETKGIWRKCFRDHIRIPKKSKREETLQMYTEWTKWTTSLRWWTETFLVRAHLVENVDRNPCNQLSHKPQCHLRLMLSYQILRITTVRLFRLRNTLAQAQIRWELEETVSPIPIQYQLFDLLSYISRRTITSLKAAGTNMAPTTGMGHHVGGTGHHDGAMGIPPAPIANTGNQSHGSGHSLAGKVERVAGIELVKGKGDSEGARGKGGEGPEQRASGG
ncbi:hypothetical protein C8J56DRAFT_1075863 [Mycena floridula]|nr:hypothetical protein C8J56DRAFT_1075863 [Mycena floridula]